MGWGVEWGPGDACRARRACCNFCRCGVPARSSPAISTAVWPFRWWGGGVLHPGYSPRPWGRQCPFECGGTLSRVWRCSFVRPLADSRGRGGAALFGPLLTVRRLEVPAGRPAPQRRAAPQAVDPRLGTSGTPAAYMRDTFSPALRCAAPRFAAVRRWCPARTSGPAWTSC